MRAFTAPRHLDAAARPAHSITDPARVHEPRTARGVFARAVLASPSELTSREHHYNMTMNRWEFYLDTSCFVVPAQKWCSVMDSRDCCGDRCGSSRSSLLLKTGCPFFTNGFVVLPPLCSSI